MKLHFLNMPAVYRLGTKWVGRFPRWVGYGLSGAVADLSFAIYGSAVQNVKSNLRLVFPSASDEDISATARRLFRNYGRYLVDYGRYSGIGREKVLDKIVSFTGKANLESVIGMKKGAILLTAHLGNWELGGIFFSSFGIKTNVISIRDEDSEIDEARQLYREKYGVNTITITDSPLSMLELIKALERGETLAMLIDRNPVGGKTVEQEFFGRPTPFPRGPFLLSRLTGAPVVAAFVVKEGEGYRGIVEEPLFVADEGEEEGRMGSVVKTLEKYIAKYPDQWYNFSRI